MQQLDIDVEVQDLQIIRDWLEKAQPWLSNMKDMHVLRTIEEKLN